MLKNKTIVLGITGSIAAYKAADLASKLVQAGADVHCVMTEPATRFISPLTLRTLTNRPVITSMWEMSSEFNIKHISLAEGAGVMVIAPTTANVIAHIRAGMAGDILTSTVLATKAPVILAPAMNDNMYNNQATQENITVLKKRGFTFIGPDFGKLASGKRGFGRMSGTFEIIGAIEQALGKNGDLAGRKIVVTAGGTREAVDPVRFIGNRSSGKMGNSLAQAARSRGAEVTLITAAEMPEDKAGIRVVKVETAAYMKQAVSSAAKDTDVLIMAAAVADYKPAEVLKDKIKKGAKELKLELVKTDDILAETRGGFIKVGFAAESRNIITNARKKLKEKQLDIIVANDITDKESGFGAESNKVTIINKDGKAEDLPLMEKREVAEKILDRVAEIFKK